LQHLPEILGQRVQINILDGDFKLTVAVIAASAGGLANTAPLCDHISYVTQREKLVWY